MINKVIGEKMAKLKKRVTTNDVGYGVKVKALDDMGLKNSEFDKMEDLFLNTKKMGFNDTQLTELLNEDLWDGINEDEF